MTESGPHRPSARVEIAPLRQSLRWRLPLLIGGLFLTVLIAVVWAAYREVEATLERGAGQRAEQAAQQVADLFAPSTEQTVAQLHRVAPLLRDYLAAPSPTRLDEVQKLLAPLAAAPNRRVTIWTAAGARLLDVPPDDAAATAGVPTVAPPAARPEAGIGLIKAEGERAYVDFAAAVTDEAGAPAGMISVRSVLSVTPPDALSRLIGGNARVLFGNDDGSLWTDMTGIQEGPSVALERRHFQVFRNATGEERVGALKELPGTPWLIWVGFPRAANVAEANAFLWRMTTIVVLVAIAAILLAHRVVAGVTTPLIAMTDAAEAIAAGDYTRRVGESRHDEIGRLGRAFNAMTRDIAADLSARQAAEAALRASEGRYRTLFDYAPDGIIIGDERRHYVDANPAMCRLLGRPREQILGLSAVDIMAPFEHQHIQPALDEIAGGAAHHREWNIMRGDGSTFAADVISTEMPDGHVMAMFRDITDRHLAVEAVRAAEERMRFALQSAGVGIWDIDFETGAVRWSDVLQAQYGLPAGSFAGTLDGFFACIHPDDRDAARATIAQATVAGTDFSLQHRIVRPDGVVRWVNGAGQIYLDDEGGRPAASASRST